MFMYSVGYHASEVINNAKHNISYAKKNLSIKFIVTRQNNNTD